MSCWTLDPSLPCCFQRAGFSRGDVFGSELVQFLGQWVRGSAGSLWIEPGHLLLGSLAEPCCLSCLSPQDVIGKGFRTWAFHGVGIEHRKHPSRALEMIEIDVQQQFRTAMEMMTITSVQFRTSGVSPEGTPNSNGPSCFPYIAVWGLYSFTPCSGPRRNIKFRPIPIPPLRTVYSHKIRVRLSRFPLRYPHFHQKSH